MVFVPKESGIDLNHTPEYVILNQCDSLCIIMTHESVEQVFCSYFPLALVSETLVWSKYLVQYYIEISKSVLLSNFRNPIDLRYQKSLTDLKESGEQRPPNILSTKKCLV